MGTAHQRRIRDTLTERDPRSSAATLHGYAIETISRHDAVPLILRYEWLGSVGRANHFIGLVSPQRELEGVACFGWGPSGPIRSLIGEPAFCLERGACVHYAPRNAASFLINGACKVIHRITGTAIFFAYADPMAGEYGGVYQAAGWTYLGQGLNGGKGRPERIFVLPPGGDPNDDAAWKTTRALRRNGQHLSLRQAEAVGWRIARRAAKHVYATHVGRERRRWLKQYPSLPYPAPDPERKRRLLADGEPLRIASPDPAPDLFRCDFFEMRVDSPL